MRCSHACKPTCAPAQSNVLSPRVPSADSVVLSDFAFLSPSQLFSWHVRYSSITDDHGH